ncbi:MAG: TRCF domain-containing protein, partial [Candidatus Gallimonas sp.]
LAQLYQLRGRVGRGSRLAHAYFTYKPERVMTEAAAERLKAIMQFTELGSGYKIAMRDLEIRGAGNVLGAEQHGHMDKVGYELYAKILREELTGRRAETVELDVKATAYIPETYVESNAGRMDCYKQIAEIRSVGDYKRVCVSMEEQYGPLPEETRNLVTIAVLKSYAMGFGVRKISVNPKGGALEFSSLAALSDERLGAAMVKYSAAVTLEMTSAPVLRFRPLSDSGETMVQMTKFLKFAATFNGN